MPKSQISGLLMLCFLPTYSEDLRSWGHLSSRGRHSSQLSGRMQRCEAVVGMGAMPERAEGGKEEGRGGAEPRRDTERGGHSLGVQNQGESWGDSSGWAAAPPWRGQPRGMAQTSCGGFGLLSLGR